MALDKLARKHLKIVSIHEKLKGVEKTFAKYGLDEHVSQAIKEFHAWGTYTLPNSNQENATRAEHASRRAWKDLVEAVWETVPNPKIPWIWHTMVAQGLPE